jgi:hypothetical protein
LSCRTLYLICIVAGAMAPIEAKGPVRVVGRGGQGSRPRLVGPEGTALTTPQPLRSPTYEMGAPARLDNTRIVGRGGMGSRPRDLPAPAPVVVPLPKQTQAPAQVVVYRPGGRGGAGSKPRAPKPPSEVRDKGKGKSPPFAWKGKGKETGNASTYGAPSLTRTDTLDSMGNGSVIQFLPVRGPQRIYQSTVGQDPIPEVPFEGGSGASVDIGARRTGRLHKLLRPRRTETPSSHSTGTRASSVSGLSIGSDAADSMSLDNTSGRRTNYESTPPIPVFQYPKPPRPPPAFPTDLESELQDDTQSEILSCDYDTNSDDHSGSCDASSVCPTPLHFEPSLESDADGDYDPYWDRARTPTAMRPNEKHLSVPFQTLVLSPPTWDSADTVVRNEVGWTGEWNCGDIREVISSLRELR